MVLEVRVSSSPSGKAIVSRRSALSGVEHHLKLPISIKQLARGVQAYNQGRPLQEAFPDLSNDQRNFLMSGITSEEWTEHIKDDAEEEVTSV